MDAATEFWTECEEYHELARRVTEGVEITHPDRAKGECSHVCGKCCWAASSVTYYELRV